MNVFDFAMKMELEGKRYYEKIAAETPHAGLRNIFTMLAADEQKHYETVLAMKEGTAGGMAESVVLTEARNVFDLLLAEKGSMAPLKGDLGAYRHAMKVEADSVRLYEDLAKREKDQGIVQLLLKIANEEKKHFNILENIYDFVSSPLTYLAWGEFSNLKEF